MVDATRENGEVILRLTEDEAGLLRAVVGNFTGYASGDGPRVVTDRIFNALVDANVEPVPVKMWARNTEPGVIFPWLAWENEG